MDISSVVAHGTVQNCMSLIDQKGPYRGIILYALQISGLEQRAPVYITNKLKASVTCIYLN